MDPVIIVDAVRTPRGRGNAKGSLRDVPPIELLGGLVAHLREKHGLERFSRADAIVDAIVDAIIGCVTQSGEQGANVARLALLHGGLSERVPSTTINRFCASSLSALIMAGRAAVADDGLALAGGVESMSRVPMASDHGALTHDIAAQKRGRIIPIGVAADIVATVQGFSRGACDEVALRSQQRAAAAATSRAPSMVPVVVDGRVVLDRDEAPRPDTTLASLSALKPAFSSWSTPESLRAVVACVPALAQHGAIAHVHTAGNSPAPADGASLILVGSAGAVERAGFATRARIIASAEVGVDRTLALTGIVDATRAVLQRAKLRVGDVDLFEVNESFASLMLLYARALGVPVEVLNVNGGAIALGHPMGATGALLVSSALDELERRGGKRALVAVGGAAGLATAVLLERA